nr:phosphatidylinositol 3-kinase, root isoform [Tanacetum cinerariifolium]
LCANVRIFLENSSSVWKSLMKSPVRMDDDCLFLVDFGYNLGQDPKSSPPPMKLCKEIRKAMSGAERITLHASTPPKLDSSDKEQGGKLGPALLQKDGSILNSSRSSGGGKSVPDASRRNRRVLKRLMIYSC